MKKITTVISMVIVLMMVFSTVVFAGGSEQSLIESEMRNEYYEMYSQNNRIAKYSGMTSRAVDVIVGLEFGEDSMSINDALVVFVIDCIKLGDTETALNIMKALNMKQAISIADNIITQRLLNKMLNEAKQRRESWYYNDLEERLINNYTEYSGIDAVKEYIQFAVLSPIGS